MEAGMEAGMEAAMKQPVTHISAVTLCVRNMEQSVRWYGSLGFVTAFGGPLSAFTTLRAGDGFLNLQADPEMRPQQGRWGRIVLWVHNVDAVFACATDAGMHPETTPADAPWGERYFHIRDLDGHELSFAKPIR
jgi:catechol 2,3-dioxygenase-like lactoylglutathione lyase family enzyme